jgi:hypothetical protein
MDRSTSGKMLRRWRMPSALAVKAFLAFAAGAGPTLGCGATKAVTPPPPCDQTCKDNIAMRAIRETMRWVYNQKLPGSPVGAQDASAQCLMNGTTGIFGDAGANPVQGVTWVDLTYVFDGCFYSPAKSATHDRNYAMTLNGTVTEHGILSVQPSSTTSLVLGSMAITLAGTVDDPPVAYTDADAGDSDGGAVTCALDIAQNGNMVSGTICGRAASYNGF